MSRLLGAAAALVWIGCHPPPAARPATAAVAAVLPAGTLPPHGVILIGDLHGTREIPAFVGRLVDEVAAREPMVLALELPRGELPSLDAFLASDGGPAARAAALRDPWWHAAYQDGRRSVAMFALLDRVRQLRGGGARIDVVCFDAEGVTPTAEEAREAAMAATLLATRAAHPDAALVVFAGNLHPRRTEVGFKPGHAWLGMRLAAAGVAFVNLDPRYAAGTAWTCPDADPAGCGAHPMGGRPTPDGVHLERSADGAYDGWVGVGALTASPPARDQP